MKIDKCCSGLSKWLSPDLFKALSDPSRVAILARLVEMPGEQTVSEVACCSPINISVVSRHLRTLRDAGIVESSKRGKEVFYRARIGNLTLLLRNLADALEACCPNGVCETDRKKND
jgi:ArsR family transcriptional regulator, arsenate/arsenite/antimonite-responsive transcriptional repressor